MPKALLPLLTLLFASTLLHAQRFDVSAGGGINNLGQGFAHGAVVASATVKLAPALSVGGEYAFQTVGAQRTGFDLGYPFGTYTVEDTQHLQDYGAVLRGGFRHHRAAQAYLLGAGGGLHVSDSLKVNGGSAQTQSRNGEYFGAGGGVSAPIGHGFGLRPEFRYEFQRLPEDHTSGVEIPASHANQILFTISLYKGFGR